MKRVLVCGGRDFADAGRMDRCLRVIDRHYGPISVVIQGECRRWDRESKRFIGADWLAKQWAEACGIEVMGFPADWNRYGRAAGPIRNQQMLDEGKPDFVIAFPGGTGTADMMSRASEAGVKVLEPAGRAALANTGGEG